MGVKKTIRVLKVEPQKAPYVKEINNSLAGCQAEVEGLIECIYLEDGCLAVVNDEGKMNGMELNRRLRNDIIAGPFFICSDGRSGNFDSLSDEQLKRYGEQFAEIEQFTGVELEAQPRMEFIGF